MPVFAPLYKKFSLLAKTTQNKAIKIDVPLYGVTHGYIKSCGHLRTEKALTQLERAKKDNPTPTAIYLTYNGKTMNISEWSKETGIPRSTISYRINKELPIEKVLERKETNEQN